MAKRKFWKSVITVTVLSEDRPPAWRDLMDLHYLITDGSCSGMIDHKRLVSMSARRAANELLKHGSDPGFFQLNDYGKDLTEQRT